MDFRSSITRKYLIALAVIAMLLIGAFVAMTSRLQQNADDGFIINTAGQQRMLSQRIALLVREIVAAPTPQAASEYAEKLSAATRNMTQNHQTLLSSHQNSETSAGVLQLYGGPQGINQRTEKYVGLSEQFITLYRDGQRRSAAAADSADSIASIARNGFLAELDGAVKAYQDQFEAGIERFRILEAVVLGIGLLVLLLEIVLIFRPMTGTISKAVESLASANEELRQFSFRLSHDLRAPIASSLGLISLAQDANTEGQPADTRYALTRIDNALKKMDLLIQDVVTITYTSIREYEPVQLSMTNLLEDTISQLSDLPGFERVTISTRIEISETITVKKEPLRNILENLISNAIKYCDPRNPQSTIDISVGTSGDKYLISVSDNGSGIDAKFHSEIFNMFTRFHPDQGFGSGLGLYLAKLSAEALSGTVSYQPLTSGSQFTLAWPTNGALS